MKWFIERNIDMTIYKPKVLQEGLLHLLNGSFE